MEMEVLLKKEETNWLLATDDGTILLIHDQNRTQRDTRSPPRNLETMKNSKNKQQSSQENVIIWHAVDAS